MARFGGPQAVTDEVRVDGRRRTYLVVAPPEGAKPHRLLLALHGSNQTGAAFRRFTGGGFDRWAQDGSGVVVYPDSWQGSVWNDARTSTPSRARAEGVDDLAFLRALAGRFGAERVDAVGYSAGGQMVIRALLAEPPLLTAAALLSATVPAAGNLLSDPAAGRPAPVLLAHGTADPLVPYRGGTASLWGFRPRGAVRSAPDSARFWARRNGLAGSPEMLRLPHRGRGRTRTTLFSFAAPGRPPVRFYAVARGGHVVPNPVRRAPFVLGRSSGDIDLPAVVLDFFEEVDRG